MKTFSAQVSDWVKKSERLTEAVFKESTQRIVGEMQKTRAEGGRMPVDTGFLRASLTPSINEMSVTLRENPGTTTEYENTEVALKIADLELGDTFYAVYAANYAAAQNFGTKYMAPAGFREGAVAQWPQIVNGVVAELKTRIG